MMKLGRGQWVSLVAAVGLAAVTFARVSAAVTITSFTAQAQPAQIVLNWKTASETNNAGFNLYRATFANGPWTTKLNGSNVIPGCPGCPLGGNYSYNDSTAAKGQTYYYRLESVEFNGSTAPFGPVSAQIAAAATATSVATPTRTGTVPPSPTNTSASVPATATSTVYRSPTPLGTPPPTGTLFPTRIAYVVGQPTWTAVPPSNVKGAPPKNNSNVPPPIVDPSPAPQAQNDPLLAASFPDEPSGAAEDSPRAVPGPIALGLIALAGILAVTGLSFGAVSFYFIARRFLH